jgi:hypothetical protein
MAIVAQLGPGSFSTGRVHRFVAFNAVFDDPTFLIVSYDIDCNFKTII